MKKSELVSKEGQGYYTCPDCGIMVPRDHDIIFIGSCPYCTTQLRPPETQDQGHVQDPKPEAGDCCCSNTPIVEMKKSRIMNMDLWLYRIYCDDCGKAGPWNLEEAEAIKAWNNIMALQPIGAHNG